MSLKLFLFFFIYAVVVSLSYSVTRSTIILHRTANAYTITKRLSGDIFSDATTTSNSNGTATVIENEAAMCTYDGGMLIFANPMSLHRNDKFFNTGIMQQRAMEIIVDEINTSPRCGIRVQNKSYSIHLITYGDDSSNDKARAIAEFSVTGSLATPSANFLLGPYSSGLTGVSVAPIANATNTLLIAGGAATTSVFQNRPSVFGTFPPTKNYMAEAIKGLSEVGAKTIVGIWESASFTKGACAPLQSLAASYNMEYLQGIEVPASPTAEDHFDHIVQNISQPEINPDVVVTCVYDAGCTEFVKSLRRADWSPKAQIFTVCIGMDSFHNAVGTDAEYMMGVTPWDSSLSSTNDAITGWTAKDFHNIFYETTQIKPTYHAASAAAALLIQIQAIEKVDTINNTQDIVSYIANQTTIFHTLYGDISFDINGQSKAPSLLIQYDTNMEVQTVYPHAKKSSNLLYPMPSWIHRDCIKLSPCGGTNVRDFFSATDAVNTTANMADTCTDEGYCLCSNPNDMSLGRGANASCYAKIEEDYTYISPQLKVIGNVLVFFQCFISIACLLWMYVYRENNIVKTSQPIFLGLTAFGALLISLAIIPIGIEDKYRYEQDIQTGEIQYDKPNPNISHVDHACMAFPWLLGIGFTIVFAALFAKIWRIKKLMVAAKFFRRVKVEVKDVLFIIFVMLFVEAIILLCWQLIDPLRWERDILLADPILGYTTKSVGKCTCSKQNLFLIPLVIFALISLFYALYLSFVTRKIPNEYQEGTWITASVIMIFQLLLLGIPIVVISSEYTDAYYVVRAGIMFLTSFSVTCLIFMPKIYKLHFSILNEEDMASRNPNSAYMNNNSITYNNNVTYMNRSHNNNVTNNNRSYNSNSRQISGVVASMHSELSVNQQHGNSSHNNDNDFNVNI